ncbi:alpha/beta hydrolase [Fretibacter rubidus]|uniref:alpha/beta hydrolase n=1 Tax=Fretibacter rubidus TaxID=570162 RepID=UPI003529EF4E
MVFGLRGENLARYDAPHTVTFDAPNSGGWPDVVQFLQDNFVAPAKQGGEAASLRAKRERFESIASQRSFDCTRTPATLTASDSYELSGEWTTIDGTDPARRILYVHGGAYAVGSAKSHRAITYNLAKRTGCAVFAINYRLIPENKRLSGVQDCKDAYLWTLANGPDGEAAAKTIAVMGDSAGGNLSLVVSRWASADSAIRTPDAIVGLSAHTDATAQSPSLKANLATDIMLQPMLAPILKIPVTLYRLAIWKMAGVKPAHPDLSPIMGDLAGLPPTLLQVSASEMLFDDNLRYATKAREYGSDVSVQSWRDMCHVWHIFDDKLSESHHAFDEIAAFLTTHGVSAKTPKARVKAKG